MSKVDFHEKVNRTIRLLLGLRHPEVRQALAPYHLTSEEIAKGWELVKEVGMARTVVQGEAKEVNLATARAMAELDAFQKLWFPIARVVLQAGFPAIGRAFFSGLRQDRGAAVPFVVFSFLDRLGALEKGDPIYGPDGPEARAHLAARGLTKEVEAKAASALEFWGEVHGEADDTDGALRAEEAASAKLWSFYLEWSAVAAKVITNRAHLRWLGLASRARTRGKAASPPLVRQLPAPPPRLRALPSPQGRD